MNMNTSKNRTKRKVSDTDEDHEEDIQSPMDSSRRRIIKATLGQAQTPEKATSGLQLFDTNINSTTSYSNTMTLHDDNTSVSSSASTQQSNLRKKQRLELLHQEMTILNYSLAHQAKQELTSLLSTLPGLSSSTNKPFFYTDAIHQYLQRAKEIEHKYNPPTGAVLTFGSGDCGQLGLTSDVDSAKRPRMITSGTFLKSNITMVSCGGLHTVSVNEDGKVETWGCNDEGSLGRLMFATAYMPIPVYGFIPSKYELATGLERPTVTWDDLVRTTNNNTADYATLQDPRSDFYKYKEECIVSVAAGECQTLALSSTGRLYFWGSYKDKEGMRFRDVPPKDDPRVYPDNVTQVADPNERLDDMDNNDDDNDNDSSPPPTTTQDDDDQPKEKDFVAPESAQWWPIHVWQIPGKVTDISCGNTFNAVIVEVPSSTNTNNNHNDTSSPPDRVCYTWGVGSCGELARSVPTDIVDRSKPLPAEFKNDKKKSIPKYFFYDLDKLSKMHLTPKPVEWAIPPSLNWKRRVQMVACGDYHLLVIAKDEQQGQGELSNDAGKNAVYSSGLNNYGQLGLGDTKNREKLTRITELDHCQISKISCGIFHSMCLDETGQSLYSFGRGDSGQLGVTATRPDVGYFKDTPQLIKFPSLDDSPPVIEQISCGGNHTLVVTDDGTVYSWGYGDMGALGHGEEKDEYQPRKVDIMEGVNRLRKKQNLSSLCAKVHSVVGGGQHSAIVASTS